jgi:hypothetical protein
VTAGNPGAQGTVIIRYAVTSAAETPPTVTTVSNGVNTGNVIMTVTQSSGTRSYMIPVAAGETASTWAATARAQLAADSTITRDYVVSGTGTSIILTSRLHQSDASLNIAIANGSPSPGINAAATSANTSPGSPDTVTPIMTIYGAIAQVSATYRGKSMTINSSITGRTTP